MNDLRLAQIAAEYGLRLVLQFGSTVTGRTHAGSDLDLAVLLDRADLSLRRYGDLLHDLQTAFPEQEVDIAVLNRADPLLLRRVAEGCRLLHGTVSELQRFKLLAFNRYQDHRRYLELDRRFVAHTLEHDFPGR